MTRQWSKEDCKKAYIESTIELRITELSILAQRDRSQVSRWSTNDPEGKWKDLRKAYQSELAIEIQKRLVEKRSHELASELEKTQERHIISYRLYERIARIQGGIILDEIEELNKLRSVAIQLEQVDAAKELGEKIKHVADPVKIKCYMDILDKAIKGEQVARGMQYFINPNAAYSLVEQMGNEVVERDYYEELVQVYNQRQEEAIVANAIEEFK